MLFQRRGSDRQLTLTQVRSLVERGEINPHETLLVGTEWKPAGKIPELRADFRRYSKKTAADSNSAEVETPLNERFAKAFVGVIAIIVGGGICIQQAAEFVGTHEWRPLAVAIISVGVIVWGITALIRPEKVELSES